jgi:hypothetical protein
MLVEIPPHLEARTFDHRADRTEKQRQRTRSTVQDALGASRARRTDTKPLPTWTPGTEQ